MASNKTSKHTLEDAADAASATPASKRQRSETTAAAAADEEGLGDPPHLDALNQISTIQEELEKLTEQAEREMRKVEGRFQELKKPHLRRRNELCSNIPEFWLRTFLGHEVIRELLQNEDDQACLKHLKDVWVEYFEDYVSGYKLVFKFDKNQWFENDVLFKEYHFTEDASNTVCSKIKWKPDHDLTVSRGTEPSSSFFVWFTEEDPDDDLARVICEDVWSDPLRFCMGLGEGDDEQEAEGADVSSEQPATDAQDPEGDPEDDQ